MSVSDLNYLCVEQERFQLSATRKVIMSGLTEVIDKIKETRLVAELWVDGSFLTEKINPEDADVVLSVFDSEKGDLTKEQYDVIEWVTGNLKDEFHCDSYVFFRYPERSSHFQLGDFMRSYWMTLFAFGRGQKQRRGIAVITLQESMI